MATKKFTSFDPSALCQVAVVVKNIDETVKFYRDVFGIGPFEILEVNFPNATYHGEKAGYRGKRAFAKLGQVTLELIELIDGKTVHEDFLKEKGEGLQHIGFTVKDLAKAEKEAEKLGLKIVQGMKREDGTGFAYLDSDRIGGVMFELIQMSDPKP
jgi:methylmalonyl-CoA/ethylmalonyl-CoA epimerase